MIDQSFEKSVWDALQDVKDPEIPVISVVDMGIISNIDIDDSNNVKITMTPTFTGCPALDYMKNDIQQRIQKVDLVNTVEVITDFSVPWSSDRITELGKKQLKGFGLAPPPKVGDGIDMDMLKDVPCPQCDGRNTSLQTPFGPTLCRSIHYCHDCKEAFQQFKPVE